MTMQNQRETKGNAIRLKQRKNICLVSLCVRARVSVYVCRCSEYLATVSFIGLFDHCYVFIK